MVKHALFRSYMFYIMIDKNVSLHILIADGSPKVRSALKLLLDHNPLIGSVHLVENISALLTHLPKTCPDVLLIDWGLIEETFNILPTIQFFCPRMHVIALSGKPDDRDGALLSGADIFVSKGDPPDHLITILEELWNEKRNQLMQTITR